MTKKKRPSSRKKNRRKRPGRRSVQERQRAVLEILSGKATVEQVATRLSVLPETVEAWKEQALASMEESFRQGSGASAEERRLSTENKQLKSAVTRLVMEKELLERALETERERRPTRPGRSRR